MTSRRPSRPRRSVRAWAPELVAAIVALGADGIPQKKIARGLDVSQAHVSRVLAKHRRAAA